MRMNARHLDVLTKLAAGDTIRGVREMFLGETFELMDANEAVGANIVSTLRAKGYIIYVPGAVPMPGLAYYDITAGGRAALEEEGTNG